MSTVLSASNWRYCIRLTDCLIHEPFCRRFRRNWKVNAVVISHVSCSTDSTFPVSSIRREQAEQKEGQYDLKMALGPEGSWAASSSEIHISFVSNRFLKYVV